MPTAQQAHNFQMLLARLADAAKRSVGQMWNSTQDWQQAVDLFPSTVEPYTAAAAQLAATWYHSLAPDQPFAVQPGPLPPAEALTNNAKYALSTDNPFGSLSLSTERHVFATAGQTVIHNADREHVRYARYASANACAFCRVIATRNTLYTSAAAAERVVGQRGRPRGTRKLGDKWHDNCHCVAVPVRAGDDYVPPEWVADWQTQYNDAVSAGEHGLDAIVNHMRRAEYAANKQADVFGPLTQPSVFSELSND